MKRPSYGIIASVISWPFSGQGATQSNPFQSQSSSTWKDLQAKASKASCWEPQRQVPILRRNTDIKSATSHIRRHWAQCRWHQSARFFSSLHHVWPCKQCELTSMFREWSEVQSHDEIEDDNTTQRTTSGQKVNKTLKSMSNADTWRMKSSNLKICRTKWSTTESFVNWGWPRLDARIQQEYTRIPQHGSIEAMVDSHLSPPTAPGGPSHPLHGQARHQLLETLPGRGLHFSMNTKPPNNQKTLFCYRYYYVLHYYRHWYFSPKSRCNQKLARWHPRRLWLIWWEIARWSIALPSRTLRRFFQQRLYLRGLLPLCILPVWERILGRSHGCLQTLEQSGGFGMFGIAGEWQEDWLKIS